MKEKVTFVNEVVTITVADPRFSRRGRQPKFAKVMFLHVSVILSTVVGGGVSQHALQVSRPTPRGGG